ncbi:hypothetical protein AOQ84DRAFT_435718 [Glonium stellatum]|uniref:Uncharacterized protein n=1 Tax=Glonium stellatum TaxID=574774 RepID=A0A8E2JYF7_9PEZI|nr:hypothetical protein AOQ84DRAFT_435718 [Glonium stellatum]
MAYSETRSNEQRNELNDFRQILEAVLQELLSRLNAPSTSKTTVRSSLTVDAKVSEARISRLLSNDPQNSAEQANSKIWEGIFSINAKDSNEFMRAFYHWTRPSTIQEVLNAGQTWTSWSYAAAFPELSKFLKRTSSTDRCHCQVDMDDLFSLRGKRCSVSYNESKNKIDAFWEEIKNRPAFSSDLSNTEPDEYVSARLFKIVDLSPFVLTALLGSTPQSDLSYMAAFVERHLKLTNWGKVSLLKFGDIDWNSYTFEYHFSFYYVTPEYSETDSIKFDPRKCRRSAPFGREMATKTRYIHEETLSFLLVGHFKDVTTCVQLAESYFKFDPYAKKALSHPFRHFDLSQSPALMLLAWISVSLHHVLWRWQSAIEAVENEIKSSAQIVFMKDRSDLMADDPQFSLSKTYFWALQAYKLFEETLLETIATWKKFKAESLPRLRDPRVTLDDWQISIQDIDDAIEELEVKVTRIRKRQKEVKDLRTGLISASALFDSRTTVRQGENIRLLTYITILFFPLSFGTSIFGMQIMGNSSKASTAFAITLPAITLGTAILVFNLQNMLDTFNNISEQCTMWLRQRMRHHRRKGWKDRAIALHEDEAVTRAPVRKAQRQSSGWVYAFFMLEYLFVSLPASEIIVALSFIGLLKEGQVTVRFGARHRNSPSVIIEHGSEMDNSESTIRRRRAEKIKERIYQSLEEEKQKQQEEKDNERGPMIAVFIKTRRRVLERIKKVLKIVFGVFRALFIPLWILLLVLEYIFLTTFLAFKPRSSPASINSLATLTKPPPPTYKPNWIQAWEAMGLDALVPISRPAVSLSHDDIQTISKVTGVAAFFTSRANTPRVTPGTPSSGKTATQWPGFSKSSSRPYHSGYGWSASSPNPDIALAHLRRQRSDEGTLHPELEDEEMCQNASVY